MKRAILLMLFSLGAKLSFSQNYIYKGSQQFPSTTTWNFQIPDAAWNGTLDICVAKTKLGGYLMLSVDADPNLSISGNIFIILEDGKTLTLSKKIVNDHVDSKSQVLYSLNTRDLDLLKNSNIEKLRFSLKFKMNGLGDENYTATNNYDNPSNPTYETASEITNLSALARVLTSHSLQ